MFVLWLKPSAIFSSLKFSTAESLLGTLTDMDFPNNIEFRHVAQDNFKTNCTRAYECFSSSGGVGLSKEAFLEALRFLFYKKVGAQVRSIVPNPDDDLSTGTILYLGMSYVLLDLKAPNIPRDKFVGYISEVLQVVLIIRKEVQ